MEALAANYKNHLDQIKAAIQHSDLLAAYLEEESADLYKQLIEGFEPHILELYELVANKTPLQLIALEKELLDPGFEGLFLPKILGYSVLRGEIDQKYKYVRPQNHFKDILLAISESANFDFIKTRIGQTVQVGFALSSDIWLTNLLDSISNKKVKSFLNFQRMEKYQDLEHRIQLYNNYLLQFKDQNYLTTEFPTTAIELNSHSNVLLDFIKYRTKRRFNNESLINHLETLIFNDALVNEPSFLEMIMVVRMFYDVSPKAQDKITTILSNKRKSNEHFPETFFKVLLSLYRSPAVEVSPDADKRMSTVIDKSIKDSISDYYTLMDVVHTKGYVHEETIEAVGVYYTKQKGLSLENECLRDAIFSYCESFLNNLDTDSYGEYFNINKVFVSYINTFDNERFNQSIKDLSLRYIEKLLAVYTDKRGRDYQDIKKFVTATFLDLGFKTEKELQDMFKTRRKK